MNGSNNVKYISKILSLMLISEMMTLPISMKNWSKSLVIFHCYMKNCLLQHKLNWKENFPCSDTHDYERVNNGA